MKKACNSSAKIYTKKINPHTNKKRKLLGCYVFSVENLDLDWKLSEKKVPLSEENLENDVDGNKETQKDLLLNLILDFAEEKHKTVFSREEFLKLKLKDLSELWPNTKTPEQTFSRLMQELRDDGWIKFLDKNGEYEIL